MKVNIIPVKIQKYFLWNYKMILKFIKKSNWLRIVKVLLRKNEGKVRGRACQMSRIRKQQAVEMAYASTSHQRPEAGDPQMPRLQSPNTGQE
jgi:hypothetical protein